MVSGECKLFLRRTKLQDLTSQIANLRSPQGRKAMSPTFTLLSAKNLKGNSKPFQTRLPTAPQSTEVFPFLIGTIRPPTDAECVRRRELKLKRHTLVFVDAISEEILRCDVRNFDVQWAEQCVFVHAFNYIPGNYVLPAMKTALPGRLEIKADPVVLTSEAADRLKFRENVALNVYELGFDPFETTVLESHRHTEDTQIKRDAEKRCKSVDQVRKILSNGSKLQRANIIGLVRAKSSIEGSKEPSYLLEVVDICWQENETGGKRNRGDDLNNATKTSSTNFGIMKPVFVLFKGSKFIKQYHAIAVMSSYYFINLKVAKLKDRHVLLFTSGSSNDPRAADAREFPSFSMIIPHAISPIVPKSHPRGSNNELVINYVGKVTRIIDPSLGIFQLDNAPLLYLSHFPHYDGSAQCYRIGTTLRLRNVHALQRYMDIDLCKTDEGEHVRYKNGKRFVMVAACAYSEVAIQDFAEEVKEDMVPKKKSIIWTDFFPGTRCDGLNIADFLVYQELYYRFLEKLPGAFTSDQLLGVPTPVTPASETEPCLIYRLMAQLNFTPYATNILHTFFDHSEKCNLASQQYPRPTCPTIKSILESPILLPDTATTIAAAAVNEFRYHIFKPEQFSTVGHGGKKDNSLPCLLGVLQGGSNGTVLLRDVTGSIPVVANSSRNIENFHLDHIYLFPSYDIVVEMLGLASRNSSKDRESRFASPSHEMQPLTKIYARLEMDKAICVCKRRRHPVTPTIPDSLQTDSRAKMAFKVSHAYPTSLEYDSQGSLYLRRYLHGTSFTVTPADGINNSRGKGFGLQENSYQIANPAKSTLALIGSAVGCIPFPKVGATYLVQCSVNNISTEEGPKAPRTRFEEAFGSVLKQKKQQNETSNSTGSIGSHFEVERTLFVDKQIAGDFQVEQLDVKIESAGTEGLKGERMRTTSTEMKDLLGSRILPSHACISPNFNLKPESDSLMSVADVLNCGTAANAGKNERLTSGYLGTLVSFTGIITERNYRQSTSRYALPRPSRPAFHDILDCYNVGTGRPGSAIHLRVIDQLGGMNEISVYVDLDKFQYALGLLPGQTVAFRRIARRVSEKGGLYCTALACTMVEVNGSTKKPGDTVRNGEMQMEDDPGTTSSLEDKIVSEPSPIIDRKTVPFAFVDSFCYPPIVRTIVRVVATVSKIEEAIFKLVCARCSRQVPLRKNVWAGSGAVVDINGELCSCTDMAPPLVQQPTRDAKARSNENAAFDHRVDAEVRLVITDGTAEAKLTVRSADHAFTVLGITGNRSLEGKITKAVEQLGTIRYSVYEGDIQKGDKRDDSDCSEPGSTDEDGTLAEICTDESRYGSHRLDCFVRCLPRWKKNYSPWFFPASSSVTAGIRTAPASSFAASEEDWMEALKPRARVRCGQMYLGVVSQPRIVLEAVEVTRCENVVGESWLLAEELDKAYD